jgi:hypothetical protein
VKTQKKKNADSAKKLESWSSLMAGSDGASIPSGEESSATPKASKKNQIVKPGSMSNLNLSPDLMSPTKKKKIKQSSRLPCQT